MVVPTQSWQSRWQTQPACLVRALRPCEGDLRAVIYPIELGPMHIKACLQRVGLVDLQYFDRSDITSIEVGKDVNDEAGKKNSQVKLPHESSLLRRSPILLGASLDAVVARILKALRQSNTFKYAVI